MVNCGVTIKQCPITDLYTYEFTLKYLFTIVYANSVDRKCLFVDVSGLFKGMRLLILPWSSGHDLNRWLLKNTKTTNFWDWTYQGRELSDIDCT